MVEEQGIHPCAIQHATKWFQTLLNCGILTFVSCTSNWWRQMFGFRRYRRLWTTMLISSHPGRKAQSESWNKPNLQCSAVFPSWQYWRSSFVWWTYEISALLLVWRMPESIFGTDLANIFTGHKLPSRPSRAQVQACQGPFVSILLKNSPTETKFLLLEMMIIQAQTCRLLIVAHCLAVCQFVQYCNALFQSRPSMIVGPCHCFCVKVFHDPVNFSATPAKTWFNHLRRLFNNPFHSLCIHVEYIRDTQRSRKDVGSPTSTFLSGISWTRQRYSASLHRFFVVHRYTVENNACFHRRSRRFPIWYFFPFKFQQNFLELSFPQQSLEWVSKKYSFEKYHRKISATFVSWKTYPSV